ncbi:MAG: hypothetical protein K1X57_12465 [Gemmataceae bacterium]|nr:hypothetical protein [Gemmataceae bacterium]
MLGFFDRLGNGWNIAAQSWAVLKRDKQLMLFPVLSGVAALVVLASFALPMLLLPGLRQTIMHAIDGDGRRGDSMKIVASVLAFAFYFVNYFVIVYFNTALAACAIYRFQGGEPTVSMGLQMANRRLPQILGWSLLAATVGMILNAIEERSELIGKIVAGILGGLWTMATYLVVPTLAVEGLGPIDALKRSTSLICSVWGESVGGNANIGIIGFLLTLPALLLMVLAVVAKLPVAVLVVLGVALVIYILAVSVVTAAIKQVFIAGLYVYATEKRVPPGFDRGVMTNAFVPKK